MPVVRHQAIKAGFYDAPGERKIHKYPIPRLGGIAIWGGFMFGMGVLALLPEGVPHGEALWGILAGSTIMFLLGLTDDLKSISPYIKLGVQFLAALVAFLLGVAVNTLDLPGSKLLLLNALSLPITMLWLVGLSNAMNFIDGLDGLAGGVTMISALTLAVMAMFTAQPPEALLASLLAGATLGFLAFNFNPAKIFMGDSGSLFCGFTLAAIAVTGVLKTKIVMMLLPLLVLVVPILDITYAVFRRLLKGQNPFLPDSNHIHHQFLKAGFTQIRTVSFLYAMCILGGLLATGYVNYLKVYIGSLVGVGLLAAGLVLAVRRLYPVAPTEPVLQPSTPDSNHSS